MSVEEELKEHAEHAKDPLSRKVAATMGIIAALLAIVAVSGHIMTTEELLSQQKASDQWAYYQAKSLRRYQSDVASDILSAISGETSAKLAEKYKSNMERYTKDGEAIQEKAKDLENESAVAGRRAVRLHIGEVFLEIAIVVCSLAILTKREFAWHAAILSATIGMVCAATVFTILH
jgi:hypothetical protein